MNTRYTENSLRPSGTVNNGHTYQPHEVKVGGVVYATCAEPFVLLGFKIRWFMLRDNITGFGGFACGVTKLVLYLTINRQVLSSLYLDAH